MDSNTWSLLLSAAGLILGFVFAYAQIRSFFARLFSSSADAAKRWSRKRQARIEAFTTHPSALVAHVTGVGLSVVFILLGTIVLLSILSQYFPATPTALRRAVSFASGLLVGAQLGALSLLSNSIKSRIFISTGVDG